MTLAKRAVKLAKKADRRSKQALKLAQRRTVSGSQAAGGRRGRAGVRGAEGPQGSAGASGAAGAAGAAGPQGPAGVNGAAGPQGPGGAQGADGARGPAGMDGAAGQEGPAGPQGPAGPEGPAGPQGPQGNPGPQGPVSDDRALITGFADKDIASGQTSVQLFRVVSDELLAQLPVVMDRAGSVVGMSVACTEARAGGSATFTVFHSGATTGFGVTIDASNPQFNSATQVSGADTFAANARLDVRVTTSSSPDWQPTSNDCEAVITIQY
jgi:Collagen triple helix repeat (20 copies)